MPKRQLVSRSILSHSIVVERRPAPVAPSTRSASSTSKFEILPLDRTRPIAQPAGPASPDRSEEHTSELQSLMRISYAVFCLKKKSNNKTVKHKRTHLHDNITRH